MGWTRTLMSLVLHYFNTVLLLPPAVCHGPLAPLRYPPASSSALGAAAHPYPHGGIYSTLLKALSEHGGSRWSADLKRRVKPEQKYIKYMTEQYKKSSRMGRSLDRESQYNTLRLIQPLDRCLHRRKEFFMQSLSFSLDQVSDEEQLLKSVLLYSFDHDLDPSTTSACYLNIKEQEYSNRCPLCPGTHHSVNFTVHEHRRSGKNWMEVDVTPFLRPLFSVQKTNVHLLVNLTCPEGPGPTGGGHVGPVALTLHSAPLLLYLNDTSRLSRQRFHLSSAAGQRRRGESNAFDEQLQFKPQSGLRIRRKRRRRRETPKSKRGGQSLDLQLPDLLPSSEFPTSDCALYDFKVRFSQLKLDHWIVFPPKYNPRYCRGICPRTMGFIYGSPVHTMVQNIIYEKLDSTVPRPTCIPSHYSPLSVMIFKEDGSYVYKEFEDMVATRCTCR